MLEVGLRQWLGSQHVRGEVPGAEKASPGKSKGQQRLEQAEILAGRGLNLKSWFEELWIEGSD